MGLVACWLLAATALKVSQLEAPTRHAPSDECKQHTALLQQAALQNDAIALRALLKSAEDAESADGAVDGLGSNGYTALIVAANNGHLAAASVLCAHGASTDVYATQGSNPGLALDRSATHPAAPRLGQKRQGGAHRAARGCGPGTRGHGGRSLRARRFGRPRD